LRCKIVLRDVVDHALAVELVQNYLIHSSATGICVSDRIVLLHLRRFRVWHSLSRQNDRDIIDMERRWMPYVDEVVEIMIKLNEGLIDFPTFLPEQFLFLLVMILQLHFLVIGAV
jgi:reverse gyrase